MLMMMRKFALLVLVVVFGWSSGVAASPIEWTVASGGNGHWYEFVDNGSTISWTDSRDAAEQRGGHLVSITSEGEDDWVIANLVVPHDPGYTVAPPWIGAYQDVGSPTYSEPGGGWTWVSGEAWSYSNWSPGEPSNGNGIEHYVNYQTWQNPRWNDNDNFGSKFSYIVEYESDPIPEPSTALLLGIGLSALAATRRRSS